MLDKSKPHLVALTGAGVSAESGLKTFRDSDGLWEGYNVYDVATPEAWKKNPEMVQDFYNMRRKSVLEAKPNLAHEILAKLENDFLVTIITQNVDDLHERAGSSNVVHLHGEILYSRSSVNPQLIYPIKGWELKMGELCELGTQLRPHIVWFGEQVPMIDVAAEIVSRADIFLIVGTSLQVYPAAGLTRFVKPDVPVYLIDPKPIDVYNPNLIEIRKSATEGILDFEKLIKS